MFAESRKAWVAGLCLVALVALDAALVHLPVDPGAQNVIKVLMAVLGAVATYAVPNAPKPTSAVRRN